MTGPLQLPDRMQRHDEQALKFEQQAERDTTAALRLLLAEAARQLAAAYLRTVGDLKTPAPPQARDGLRAAVDRVITALATGLLAELPGLVDQLNKVIAGGLRLGAGTGPGRVKVDPRPTRALAALVGDIATRLRDDVAAAQRFAAGTDLRRWGDVTTVLAKATQAVNAVAAGTREAANKAINDGARAAAEADGAQVLWIAERNACLTCLAYSGELADPGEPFPAGLTFGKTSTVKVPILSPPAHPNCRCRMQPWYGQDEPFGVPLPSALRREAQRSVLRGDSDYASRPAKLNAAGQLLAQGTSGLPDSVKLRAQMNVAAGLLAWRPAARTTRP